jgi:photosystem II stability/assembly factor-like uncharacterized protein
MVTLKTFSLVLLLSLLNSLSATAGEKPAATAYKIDGATIFCTTDGFNWTAVPLQPILAAKGGAVLDWNPARPEELLAAGRGVVYRSASAGKNWVQTLRARDGFVPKVFARSKKNPFVVYVGGGSPEIGTEVYESRNGGVSWIRMYASRENADQLKIDADNADEKAKIAFTNESGNGGGK